MTPLPKLNFPAVRLRARRRGDKIEVWDDLRGMYLVLTPEEWVRRHLIACLIGTCRASPRRIVQEYVVALNGQQQRADVVVMGVFGQPLLLAECKAPDVPVNDAVLAQAVRYNSVVRARYVILTNGFCHRCYELREDGYHPLRSFPELDQE